MKIEDEFRKNNPDFYQANLNTVDDFDEEKLENYLANSSLKKLFRAKDLVPAGSLKKLSDETLSDFIVYSDEELLEKKAFEFYKVSDFTHPKLKSVTSVRNLKLAQRVGWWANIFKGNPITTNLHTYFLVEGGMSVRGIPDPAVEDTPEGERDSQSSGPKIPNVIGEELILEMLKWDVDQVTLNWFCEFRSG